MFAEFCFGRRYRRWVPWKTQGIDFAAVILSLVHVTLSVVCVLTEPAIARCDCCSLAIAI
jgi:hypothetical protein